MANRHCRATGTHSPNAKNQSTPAMYPNGHEVVYPVCMCGSACLSVLDAACRAPPSSAHGRGCCEHSVTSPGGRPSPGADHGGQGWGLEEARGQAQSSLQGHILQKNQPSSEWASGHGEHNSALGSSGSSGCAALGAGDRRDRRLIRTLATELTVSS